MDAVAQELTLVGASHELFYDAGVKAKFYNIFAESLIECTMEWGDKSKRTDDLRKAWAIVAAFISEKLKQGMNDQRRRQSDYQSGVNAQLMQSSQVAAKVVLAEAGDAAVFRISK